MMRIVQSYNGAIDGNRDITVWLMALSATYRRNLAVRNVLYIDEIGRRFLGPVVDLYDEILPFVYDNRISWKCFAATKFIAMQNEPLGSVHIDNDVLLKTDEVIDKIARQQSTCDVIVQGIERYEFKPYSKCILEYAASGYSFDVDIYHHTPVNTGVVCFMNKELRDDYYARYFDAALHISKWLDHHDEYDAPDYVPEQTVLYSLCKDGGYKIGEILDRETIDDCRQQAIDLGYAHFWGKTKLDQIREIRRRLYELNRDLYMYIRNNFSMSDGFDSVNG